MTSVQWRPEVNALTLPQTYKIRYIPRTIIGYDDLAAEIAAEHPNYNADLVKSISVLLMKRIQRHLINGNQVTLRDAFTCRLSFSGSLNSPDSPLPNRKDLINVKLFASPNFVKAVRRAAKLERLPMAKKVPLISSAQDTLLKLDNVLMPGGLMQLTGTHLAFTQGEGGGECVIKGTRSGKATQTRLPVLANTLIMLMPDIPAQEHPWNNEYTLSVSTRYSSNGSLRTGTYSRMLRSPLLLTLPVSGDGTGILTGNADAPYVRVTGGAASAAEMLRIQAVFDPHSGGKLLVNLLDMQEGGSIGPEVQVSANGTYTLDGFPGSAVTRLEIQVDNLDALISLVRNSYAGRLADVLDVKV